jgi:hypothetical protein
VVSKGQPFQVLREIGTHSAGQIQAHGSRLILILEPQVLEPQASGKVNLTTPTVRLQGDYRRDKCQVFQLIRVFGTHRSVILLLLYLVIASRHVNLTTPLPFLQQNPTEPVDGQMALVIHTAV